MVNTGYHPSPKVEYLLLLLPSAWYLKKIVRHIGVVFPCSRQQRLYDLAVRACWLTRWCKTELQHIPTNITVGTPASFESCPPKDMGNRMTVSNSSGRISKTVVFSFFLRWSLENANRKKRSYVTFRSLSSHFIDENIHCSNVIPVSVMSRPATGVLRVLHARGHALSAKLVGRASVGRCRHGHSLHVP